MYTMYIYLYIVCTFTEREIQSAWMDGGKGSPCKCDSAESHANILLPQRRHAWTGIHKLWTELWTDYVHTYSYSVGYQVCDFPRGKLHSAFMGKSEGDDRKWQNVQRRWRFDLRWFIQCQRFEDDPICSWGDHGTYHTHANRTLYVHVRTYAYAPAAPYKHISSVVLLMKDKTSFILWWSGSGGSLYCSWLHWLKSILSCGCTLCPSLRFLI